MGEMNPADVEMEAWGRYGAALQEWAEKMVAEMIRFGEEHRLIAPEPAPPRPEGE